MPNSRAMSVSETSHTPVPAAVFDQFPGRWVAVQRGSVLADAATLHELDADARVLDTATRFRVPEKGAKFF